MFKVRSLQEKSELLGQLKVMYFVGIVIFVDDSRAWRKYKLKKIKRNKFFFYLLAMLFIY